MTDAIDATDVTDEVKIPPFAPYFVAHGYGYSTGKFFVFSNGNTDGDDGYRTKEEAYNDAETFCVPNSIRVFQLGGDPKPVDSCSTRWISLVAEACKEMDQDNLVETIVDHAPAYAMDRLRKELCLGDPKPVGIDWDQLAISLEDWAKAEINPPTDVEERLVGAFRRVRILVDQQLKGSSDGKGTSEADNNRPAR